MGDFNKDSIIVFEQLVKYCRDYGISEVSGNLEKDVTDGGTGVIAILLKDKEQATSININREFENFMITLGYNDVNTFIHVDEREYSKIKKNFKLTVLDWEDIK